MATLRVEGLPQGALEAGAVFHAEWLPRVRILLDPPPLGEEAARSADGGGIATEQAPSAPLRSAPLPKGEDLVLIFPPADYTHRTWRLAVVQGLAREHAPTRVNALAGGNTATVAAALAYLASADGVTGQYIPLADLGAGPVV